MKRAILVLGPPRSGTSVVAHVIHKLGVDFGDHDRYVDTNVQTYNPIFYELQSLNELNDAVFTAFSKSYDDFDWMPQTDDFDKETIDSFQERIATFIEEEFHGSNTIGLKDPRFCVTLPLWSVVLKRLGVDVHCVLTRRKSSAVFESNISVNQASPAYNFRLLTQSTLLANQFLEGEKYSMVRYEELLSNPTQTIERLCVDLRLDHSLIGEASSVVQADLDHQNHKMDSHLYHYFQTVIDTETIPIEECLRYREIFSNATFDQEQKITILNEEANEQGAKITNLNQELKGRDQQIAILSEVVVDRDHQVADLQQSVDQYRNSMSWRFTRPLRFLANKVNQLGMMFVFIGVLLFHVNELIIITLRMRGRGWAIFEFHLRRLQSEEYAAQISRERGIPLQFLHALIMMGSVILKLKQWWFSNTFRRKATLRIFTVFRSKRKKTSSVALKHIRFHIDNPSWLFKFVNKSFVISGWCVDLEACNAGKVRIQIGKVALQPHVKQREDVQMFFKPTCGLPEDIGFAAVPSLSFGFNRLRIDAESPDGTWVPIRRTLLFCIAWKSRKQQKLNLTYKTWSRIEYKIQKAELSDITRHVDVMVYKPSFTVVLDIRQQRDGWEKSVKSVRKQMYPNYELCILADSNTVLPAALKNETTYIQHASSMVSHDNFIVFIESGQMLSSNALYEFANALNYKSDIDLIYGDEDHIDTSGIRIDPFYKPDWSPDYLETFNYIGIPACYRATIALECAKYKCAYDLVLRFTERTTKIFHIPKILGHTLEHHVAKEVLDGITAQKITALQGRLERTGRIGLVREHQLHSGCYEIQLELQRQPLVSIIIPTAGETVTVEDRKIDLILNIVDQIRNKSTYSNIEIIVVDNGDLSEIQIQELAKQDCSRITYTDPIFNIPKKLNMGAMVANGELLLLMNDDIDILTPSWIEHMVEHFEKPHVGVVGAKLLYPDKRTQHVGVVHNFGNPDHVRRLFPKDDAGYYFSTCGVRNYMAVTGAAMMTRSSIYHEVGGYSEELAVSYNDADYCMKVHEEGFMIVYAPKVELVHMESQSRVPSADSLEAAWYHKRWASEIVSDPYYNEQFLTVASPTFVPCINPRLL